MTQRLGPLSRKKKQAHTIGPTHSLHHPASGDSWLNHKPNSHPVGSAAQRTHGHQQQGQSAHAADSTAPSFHVLFIHLKRALCPWGAPGPNEDSSPNWSCSPNPAVLPLKPARLFGPAGTVIGCNYHWRHRWVMLIGRKLLQEWVQHNHRKRFSRTDSIMLYANVSLCEQVKLLFCWILFIYLLEWTNKMNPSFQKYTFYYNACKHINYCDFVMVWSEKTCWYSFTEAFVSSVKREKRKSTSWQKGKHIHINIVYIIFTMISRE